MGVSRRKHRQHRGRSEHEVFTEKVKTAPYPPSMTKVRTAGRRSLDGSRAGLGSIVLVINLGSEKWGYSKSWMVYHGKSDQELFHGKSTKMDGLLWKNPINMDDN